MPLPSPSRSQRPRRDRPHRFPSGHKAYRFASNAADRRLRSVAAFVAPISRPKTPREWASRGHLPINTGPANPEHTTLPRYFISRMMLGAIGNVIPLGRHECTRRWHRARRGRVRVAYVRALLECMIGRRTSGRRASWLHRSTGRSAIERAYGLVWPPFFVIGVCNGGPRRSYC